MNKVLLESKNTLIINESINHTIELIDNNTEYNIEISQNINTKINIISKHKNNKINITLKQYSKVVIDMLTINDSSNITINLNEEYANVEVNYSAINYEEANYKITVNHNCSRTISNVISHGVSVLGEKILFDINGIIKKESEECICNQSSKIINIKDSKSVIMPNLYIDNYNVEANHSAYIGEFNDEQLFYLTTRGINKKDALFLLLKSFLINKMSLEEELESNYVEEIYKIKEV